MVRFVLSLAIVLIVTHAAVIQTVAARDLYVNNLTGDDRSDGSSTQPVGQYVGPVRTIAKALRLARKGDHLIIANTGQPYRECVTLQAGNHSGWADIPFVIEGNGAILDGSIEVPDDQWEHYIDGLFRFQPEHTAYHQLFREGIPLERVSVAANGVMPPLEPLQWCLFDRHVYFRPEENRLPESYRLTHSGHRVGITLYQVRHVIVSDLTVQGYQLDGINCHSNVHNGTLVGIISRGNGRSGVSIGGASRVTVAASLIGNNGAAQLRVEGHAKVELINNNLLNNTAPALVNEGARVIENNTDLPVENAEPEAPEVGAPEPEAIEADAPQAGQPTEPMPEPADENPFSF